MGAKVGRTIEFSESLKRACFIFGALKIIQDYLIKFNNLILSQLLISYRICQQDNSACSNVGVGYLSDH